MEFRDIRPVLQKVDAQHLFHRLRLRAVTRFRVMRLDQRQQSRPRDHRLHLAQKSHLSGGSLAARRSESALTYIPSIADSLYSLLSLRDQRIGIPDIQQAQPPKTLVHAFDPRKYLMSSISHRAAYANTVVETMYPMIIDGKKVHTDRQIDVINPATGLVFASVPRADEAVLDAAVAAAQRAFPLWSAMPLPERAALMHKLADSLQQHADEFARLIVMEQGKPLAEAREEAPSGVGLLRYMADHVDYAPVVLKSDGDTRIVEHRRPLGAVAAITPWNVPLQLLLIKLAPALFAGNTVVAKPAATTPLSTCLLAEIWNEILPPGVFNVICDDNDLGDALSSHPGIEKIGFTGSTATGMKVMASAG